MLRARIWHKRRRPIKWDEAARNWLDEYFVARGRVHDGKPAHGEVLSSEGCLFFSAVKLRPLVCRGGNHADIGISGPRKQRATKTGTGIIRPVTMKTIRKVAKFLV